jgi:phenylalanine-4-hydroxylase
VAHHEFAAAEVAHTPFDFSRMQDVLFVVPSLAVLRREVEGFLAGRAYRDLARA